MGFRLLNTGEFKARLGSSTRIAKEGGAAALKEISAEIKEASQDRAPEKSGNLVDAHYYRKTVDDGGRVVYEVGVNEAEAPYALRMHEGIDGGPYNLGKKSKDKNAGMTPHVGEGVGWKYLERAFNAKYRAALKKLEQALGKVFKAT